MQQAPVSLREPLQEFADLEVIGGHGANPGHQFLADVFGEGLLVHLGGELIPALGGISMERALEEVQGGVDLAFDLIPAKLEDFALIAHAYAYYYAYFKATKSAKQGEKSKLTQKTVPKS